jgi:hypothetical protein
VATPPALPEELPETAVVLRPDPLQRWTRTAAAAICVVLAAGGYFFGGWSSPVFAVLFLAITAGVCGFAWHQWSCRTVCGPNGITGAKGLELVPWRDVDYFTVRPGVAGRGVGISNVGSSSVVVRLVGGTVVETHGEGSLAYAEKSMREANGYMRVVKASPQR